MRKVIPIFIVALIAVSCASSQKMLQRGQYDRAIDKASEKLMKKPEMKKSSLC